MLSTRASLSCALLVGLVAVGSAQAATITTITDPAASAVFAGSSSFTKLAESRVRGITSGTWAFATGIEVGQTPTASNFAHSGRVNSLPDPIRFTWTLDAGVSTLTVFSDDQGTVFGNVPSFNVPSSAEATDLIISLRATDRGGSNPVDAGVLKIDDLVVNGVDLVDSSDNFEASDGFFHLHVSDLSGPLTVDGVLTGGNFATNRLSERLRFNAKAYNVLPGGPPVVPTPAGFAAGLLGLGALALRRAQ
ncbi:hypothetical protein [Mucisphaera sp.]|uniref:hypothetical protein n=1 Tax=Mucisphaera sp. TaxID=2913024 RepID=UPI003D0D6FAF